MDVFELKNYEIKNKIDHRHCLHNNLEVDEQYRLVTCKNCNKIVDPYDVILKKAIEEEQMIRNIERLRKTEKELIVKIDDLKKEEVNVKNRIKRAIKHV